MFRMLFVKPGYTMMEKISFEFKPYRLLTTIDKEHDDFQ